jgi:predicted negative regulator of RcsB-dependent stress response|tara:strand:- start:1015 stop:1659 length:645 start_codon:yes stop_codon:yes gene_type:complete
MDEEIQIINTNTRIEKIKNFFISKRKTIITTTLVIILLLISFFGYLEFKDRKKAQLANKFNLIVTKFESNQKANVENELIAIIEEKDKTYSPLAFYFLLDNNLINSNEKINNFFDLLINDIKLEKEIKNLTIYKKALFNSDFVEENELLNILNPVIRSESIWKPQALYLMAEFYLAKNQKQKSKDFFNQITSLDNISPKIKLEVQRRLRSEFSE